jgi:hypothetical protein
VNELLPTPTARDGKGSGQNPKAAWDSSRLTGIEHRDDPTGAPAPLLPTPIARDHHARGAGSDARSPGLSKLIQKTDALLPTPLESDGPKGGPNRADGAGNPYLSGVQNLLPTPTSQAAKHGETVDETASGHGYNLWDLGDRGIYSTCHHRWAYLVGRDLLPTDDGTSNRVRGVMMARRAGRR